MSDIPVDPSEKPVVSHSTGDTPTSGSANSYVPKTGALDALRSHRGESDMGNLQTTSPEARGEVSERGSDPTPNGETTSKANQPTESSSTTEPSIQEGKVHTGKVIRITSEEVIVGIGDKWRGSIPMIEFAAQPIPKESDEISVLVERFDHKTGTLALSRRHAIAYTFWQSVQPGDALEGVVTGMNKGGLDIDIGGARAFLPASQVDVRRMHDISLLIGEHIRCIVTQVDRTTHDLIVSRRKFIERDRKEKRAKMLNSLDEGSICVGIVSSITDFGAFIDLGGIDGLLHVTDMSWGRIGHPREIMQEGQQIEVRVLKVNKKSGKVSLGLKQIKPDPWDGVEQKYTEGSRIKGRVVRIVEFGAFLELEEGVDALLPISEMSWSRRVNHPSELIKVGDIHEVVVLKVDKGKRRISVGLKHMMENPWDSVESRFPINEMRRGKISKVAEFGAFVQLDDDIEGLIHISELSEKRVRSVADVVQVGQEVEVRVVKVDPEAQRISLSMKPASQTPSSANAQTAGNKIKKKKRPRKTLRGGLASHFDW